MHAFLPEISVIESSSLRLLLGTSQNIECALEAIGGDVVMGTLDLRVLPLHQVALQPPIRYNADDHCLEVELRYVDVRGKRVLPAIELIESLDESRGAGCAGLEAENLPGIGAPADIASDEARHVGIGGDPFREGVLSTWLIPLGTGRGPPGRRAGDHGRGASEQREGYKRRDDLESHVGSFPV